MHRSWGIAVASLMLAAGVPAAQSAPGGRARSEAARVPEPPAGFPDLPPEVEAWAARERVSAAGSNIMWANLVTRPHKGYDWGVSAFKARPSARTLLRFAFVRSAAQETQLQTSEFSWTMGSRALRMDSDLRPASLTTRGGMGSNGAISMELSEPGQFARQEATGECSGTVSVRIARFGGRFRFNARDEYFGKIDLRRAKVFLYREHDLRCASDEEPLPPYCLPELAFDMVDEGSGVAVGAFRTKEGRVDQRVVVAGTSGDARAVHTISVEIAVPEAFQASEDVTSASIDGDAAGPWLSGDLSYVAPPGAGSTDEDCGDYRQSSGIATGDYTAHFDSVGPVTPATAGMAATLRRDL